jgi:hypothetical protein
MAILTGEHATLYIGSKNATIYALSDISLSMDRGVVEQELVGQAGNYFTQGALSIDGSLTNCRFAASGNSDFLDSIVEGTVIKISGQLAGSDALKFAFASCQVSGYDVTIGDSSTITEASIDFTVMNPKDVTYNNSKVGDI